MDRLADKVALVTGAGRGIGRGVAGALASEGAAVAVVEVDPETAAATGAALRERGARAHTIVADVRTRAACEAAVAECARELGGVDVLVNNAAWNRSGTPLADVTDAQLERTLAVSTWATFWLMQSCRPHFLERGGGAIVNFASGAGALGLAGEGPYAAAKEAVRALTRVAAREWGPEGIRANVVCPFADSPGMQGWAEAAPEAYRAFLATVPLRRVGRCEQDVGRCVVFLASDDAAYVTGQTLWVDGGSGSVR